MKKNILLHLFFVFTVCILLTLKNIDIIGADFHSIPKHLYFQDDLKENVLLFSSQNNPENSQKYVVKGYPGKDMAVAELTASSAAHQANIQVPYVQQVPQETIFEMENQNYTLHDIVQILRKRSPFPLESILTIHPYIAGKTLEEDNPLKISIQHLKKPKYLHHITHHADLAKLLGFNIFVSDQDCHQGNILKQQLNDDTVRYWNIDTDYSLDEARDTFKDQWGKNLEELTSNTSPEEIVSIKKSLQRTGFAYKAHQYLSRLKATDLSEQHKKSLRIVNTTLQELTQTIPATNYSESWLKNTESVGWELNDVQKLVFTEMITTNHNNTQKVIKELDHLIQA